MKKIQKKYLFKNFKNISGIETMSFLQKDAKRYLLEMVKSFAICGLDYTKTKDFIEGVKYLHGIQIYNIENLTNKPTILLPNHSSDMDALIHAFLVPHCVVIAKKTWADDPEINGFFAIHDIKLIGVDRKDDESKKQALLNFMHEVRNGRNGVLYVEGTIGDILRDTPEDINDTIIELAARRNIPIQPIFSEQPECIGKEHTTRVVIGKSYIPIKGDKHKINWLDNMIELRDLLEEPKEIKLAQRHEEKYQTR